MTNCHIYEAIPLWQTACLAPIPSHLTVATTTESKQYCSEESTLPDRLVINLAVGAEEPGPGDMAVVKSVLGFRTKRLPSRIETFSPA